jgi:hypothetical protein
VALPKLFAERLADLTKSPALLGVIAAAIILPQEIRVPAAQAN